MVSTLGVDLSNILWEQAKILGQKVAITDETMGISQLLGRPPVLPPKSTPMCVYPNVM